MKRIRNICYRIFIKDLFATKGRANRTEYVVRFLLMLMFVGINHFLHKYIDGYNSILIVELAWVSVTILIIFIAQVFFVTHRRLHDLNFSGWWQLLTIPGSVAFLAAIALAIFKGTRGPNNYGEQPGNFFGVDILSKNHNEENI